MDKDKQVEKMIELFNKEQGAFAYYTCGLLVVMLGYSFKLVMESSGPFISLPLIAIFAMFISLSAGIYFLKHRVSNYYNVANLITLISKTTNEKEKRTYIDAIKSNSSRQSFYMKFHWFTIAIGPLMMFCWLIILKCEPT